MQLEVRLVTGGYEMQLPLLPFVSGCVLVPESVSAAPQQRVMIITTFPRRFFSLLYWQTYSSSESCQQGSNRKAVHEIPMHLEHGACPTTSRSVSFCFPQEVAQLPLQRVRMRWQ